MPKPKKKPKKKLPPDLIAARELMLANTAIQALLSELDIHDLHWCWRSNNPDSPYRLTITLKRGRRAVSYIMATGPFRKPMCWDRWFYKASRIFIDDATVRLVDARPLVMDTATPGTDLAALLEAAVAENRTTAATTRSKP